MPVLHAQKNLGEKADASNLKWDLLSLLVELMTDILDYFFTIGITLQLSTISVLLPEFYLARYVRYQLSAILTQLVFCDAKDVLAECCLRQSWRSSNAIAMVSANSNLAFYIMVKCFTRLMSFSCCIPSYCLAVGPSV